MFARKTDDGLASLAKHLDDLVAQNLDKKAKSTVVLTVSNPDAVRPELEKMAKDQKLAHVPLTIAADGEKGPGAYQLAKSVTFTAVIYDKKKVVSASLPLDALDAKSQESVLAEFAKVLGVEAPKVAGKDFK